MLHEFEHRMYDFKRTIHFVMLALALNFGPNAYANPACDVTNLAGSPRNLIPSGKGLLKKFRSTFESEAASSVRQLRELLRSGGAANQIERVRANRKVFILLRHYAELYTKNGKLDDRLESLTVKLGKLADAADAKNQKALVTYHKELNAILKGLPPKKVETLVKSLKISGKGAIHKKVKGSIKEIDGALGKKKIGAEEFHSLKKAVRRLSSITNFRVKYQGASPNSEINLFNASILDRLGETTDKIARMRINRASEHAKAKFQIPDDLRQDIRTFLNGVEVSAL